nr:MAG TPA: minor capsid protein [Caudoviricetes sp.]
MHRHLRGYLCPIHTNCRNTVVMWICYTYNQYVLLVCLS